MNIIDKPENFLTNGQEWWMIFESETRKIIVPPNQCSGYTSSPFTMIVANSKEECDQFIIDSNLFIANFDNTLV